MFEGKKIVIYDFETNGLLDNPNVQPTEFAAIEISTDGEVTEHSYLVKCSDDLSLINPANGKSITDLTGITNEMLDKDGIELEQLYEILSSMFNQLNIVVVGHNILNFDNVILNNCLRKVKSSFEVREDYCFDTAGQFKGELLGWKKFDNATYANYHKACLNARRKGMKFNLGLACEHYGVTVVGEFHRALTDIRNNKQVLIRQLEGLGICTPQLLKYKI